MTLWRDTLRSLRSSPIFATMTILALGLALALNTTTFAIIDAVMHPVEAMPEPERVFHVVAWGGGPREKRPPVEEWESILADGVRSLGEVATYAQGFGPVEVGPAYEELMVIATGRPFFALTRQRPETGRLFSEDGVSNEAVISFRLWKRLFAGRALSDTLELTFRGRVYAVTGVLPRSAHFPYDSDVWIPETSVRADTLTPPRMLWRYTVVRLRPGLSEARADTLLQGTADRLTARFAAPGHAFAAALEPMRTWAGEMTLVHKTMAGVAVIVLLIACANVGAMMLARGMARRREIALRMALGATRRRVMSAVLLECGLLTATGMAVGVLLTTWSLRVLAATMSRSIRVLGDIAPVPSTRVFLFVLAVAATTLVLAGALPALQSALTDPASPMKDGAGTTSRNLGRHHGGLIVTQVALSTGLLMGAVLLMRSTAQLAGFNFSYPADRLATASINLPRRAAYPDSIVQRSYDALVARVRQLPGVRGVSTEHHFGNTVVVSEQGLSGNRYMPLGSYRVVGADYLAAMGIPILAGRDLAEADRRNGAVVVDQAAVKKLWPDVKSPVGHMIKLKASDNTGAWLRVVGVARTTEMFPKRDADLEQEPALYVLLKDDEQRDRTLVARADRDMTTFPLELRRAVQQTLPGVAGRTHRWLESVESRLEYATFLWRLFFGFGLFAVVLTGVGLYGTLSYSVGRRTREFGIRFALGATARAVSSTVVRHAVVLLLAGIGIGAFLALALTRYISDLLYTVPFAEVVALIAAELLLLLVGALAAFGPVRRAVRSDPVEIMRAV